MATAVICVVGASDSGKTTLVEKLVPALTGRGYRVGSIKHAAHGFQIDREGKDSFKHVQAGASPVVIFSATELALIKKIEEEPTLDELVSGFFGEVDIVVAEGFKWEKAPKILVYRSDLPNNLQPTGETLAIFGDPSPWPEIRHFDSFNLPELVTLIERELSLRTLET